MTAPAAAVPVELSLENFVRLKSCLRPHRFARVEGAVDADGHHLWRCRDCGGLLGSRLFGWCCRGRADARHGDATPRMAKRPASDTAHEENLERLVACPRPHRFALVAEKAKGAVRDVWRCEVCSGTIGGLAYGWYVRGIYDAMLRSGDADEEAAA